MIPVVDDFLQHFIAEKIKWLKDHPIVIDHIFHTSRRSTLKKLKEFICNTKIKVLIGYPRTEASLPCYVITVAGENEQPAGLGDNFESYEDFDLGDYDEQGERIEKMVADFVSGTYMNANYRIECWSDNGDLTSYMYIILKWCLWASRQEMLDIGWNTIKLNGTDLEPVPDYMPVFVFRRTVNINLLYENFYYEKLDELERYTDVLEHPDNYTENKNGDIIDKETGEIVIPKKFKWILIGNTYDLETDEITSTKLTEREYDVD